MLQMIEMGIMVLYPNGGVKKSRVCLVWNTIMYYLCFMIDEHLKIREGIAVYDLGKQEAVIYTDITQAADHVGRSSDGLSRALKRVKFYYVGNFMVCRVSVIGSRRSQNNKKGNPQNLKKG